MRVLLLALAVLAFSLQMPAPSRAVEPDEILDDPVLEGRARELSEDIRCLVCQNESIDSSNADLARELRIIVRERLVAGDSDRQVFDYLVARYGDYVLLRPPFKPATYALWFGPLLVLLLGSGAIALVVRQRRARPVVGPPQLTAEERGRLDNLLDEAEVGGEPGEPGAS